MKCTYCLEEMIWGGDHSYEDYGMDDDDDGIVTNHSCQNDDCNVETIIVYAKL
jgi:hypothetical protein